LGLGGEGTPAASGTSRLGSGEFYWHEDERLRWRLTPGRWDIVAIGVDIGLRTFSGELHVQLILWKAWLASDTLKIMVAKEMAFSRRPVRVASVSKITWSVLK
jgi:hypothetical protein